MRADIVNNSDDHTVVELRVGDYKLRWILPDDGEFTELWLVNKDDEGMTVSEGEAEQMLEMYFRANF